MTDQFDVSTLNWVKGEIDETLKEARVVLEKYAENPEDEAQIHFCAIHLHQVAGTLEMVELYGAAKFAEEMQGLADALPGLSPREPAFEVLMRALLLLPDYLEVLQSGQPDSPLILLPLLNELRRARGERELTASAVFQPRLDVEPPAFDEGAGDMRKLAQKQRPRYQAALLKVLTGADVARAAKGVGTIFGKLAAGSRQKGLRRWFWAGGALTEAVSDGSMPLEFPCKLLLRKYDQVIKELAAGGEEALKGAAIEALLRATLFEIGKSSGTGPQVSAIRSAFRLDALLPPPAVLEKIRTGLGGFNSELKKAVSRDVMEELSRIKDVLDLFGRSQGRSATELRSVADALAHIADVLGLLRENVLGDKLLTQGDQILRAIESGEPVDESLLMDVAESVLSVESALSDWGAIAPMERADDVDSQVAVEEASPEAEAEHRRVIRQVMKEAKDDLVKSREAINAYVLQPGDKNLVAEAPRLMRQIAGSLVMLSYRRVAQVIKACQRFVEREIVAAPTLPGEEIMDALADAMMSVEYYLEAFVESRVHPSSVLDVAERAVAKMGYPVDALEDDVLSPSGAPQHVDLPESYEVEELAELPPPSEMELAASRVSPAPVALKVQRPAAAAPAPVQVSGATMDDEIVGIFIEEAEEEFSKIAELLPRWSSNTEDTESLRELRRSFHTLKGSGRLVGAAALGEFAWAFENLLNRVLDQSVAPSPALFDILDQGRQTLPELLNQFRGGPAPQGDVEGLQEMAFALAKKEPPAMPLATPSGPAEVYVADPLLRDIYTREAESHLAQLGAFVASCRVTRSRVTDALVRALHTLCGSSRTAGVAPVAELSGMLEKYAKARQTSGTPVEPEAVDLLAESAGFVASVVRYLRGEQPTAPALGELPRRAAALLSSTEGAVAAAPAAPTAEAPVEHFLETDEAALASAFEGETEMGTLLPPLDFDFGPEEETIVIPPVREAVQMEAPVAAKPQAEEIVFEALPEFAEGRSDAAPSAPPAEPSAPPQPARETPELLDVFANEATDLLSASDDLLQEWKDHPEDRRPVEALQRLLHTLKGSARWAGVSSIADLGHALESTFAAVVEGRLPPREEVLHLARRAQDGLEALLREVKGGQRASGIPDLIDELKRLVATAAATSQAAPVRRVSDYDPELLAIFLEEGHEILNASDETLQSWIASPEDKRLVENLQRHLHTLKGGARMAGVAEIGDLGHALESMLAGVADGIVAASSPMFALLQKAQDRLAVMLEQVRHHDPVPLGDDLIAEIDALVGGREPSEAAPADVPEALPVPVLRPEPIAAAQDPATAVPELVPVHEQEHPDGEGRDRRGGARPQFELVRVRSDLLDNMVNVAGEASIFRSRVEQQIGGFRFNLSELNQVIERLRERLRMFDIETEAQIQSRYEEAAQQGYEDFDPLEFDRFTHMQQISRSMVESVGDLSSIGSSLHAITRETETLLVQQARANTELQEGLMHTRMVPLVQNAPRLRRIVRQTCEELGKEAELRFKGAEVEMDRNVVERIMAPLEHLLRNAVAHGIEAPAAREAKGKPRAGVIVVDQVREGAEVVIRVKDDGAGINVDVVREKAIARGLMRAGAQLPDREIMSFILESGFSTAESLTQIAGRGVGMDVVHSEVKNLNGSLAIDSERGKGTVFTIRLPMTLTVSRALLVYAGEDMYAVPLLSIEGIVRASDAEISALLAKENPKYRWLSNDYDIMHLATILGASGVAPEAGEDRRRSVLLAHSGEHRVALVVDGLIGSREIVVKPIGRQLGGLRALSGATILGDGRVALILELPSLIRAGLARRSAARATVEATAEEGGGKPTVMVVDDSITVRKVTSRLLERNDMNSVSAKDGMEAVTLLQDVIPDVMLLDIEMPRMDGYELATHVRNEPRLRNVPIIMITSRSGEKHRQRAMQIGVNIYMTKPFQESELLENIRSLLKGRRAVAAH